MSSSSGSSSSSSGPGLGTILGVVFIVLKLTGVIGWSWWWVTLPLWIGWAIFGGFALLGLVLVLLVKALGGKPAPKASGLRSRR